MQSFRPLAVPINRPVRLGVLISGGGTTLMNFLSQIQSGHLEAEVPLVVSSRANCGGVERARNAGLNCVIVPRREAADPRDFSASVFEHCRKADVDLVVLAGFLSLLHIPEDFTARVLNIHPALIPAFCGQGMYGHRVHEAVLEKGAKVSGVTVHFADNEYDHGPIILQRCVPVEEDDTPDSLAARIFKAECEAYPAAIRLFAEGRLVIEAGRVRVRERVSESR